MKCSALVQVYNRVLHPFKFFCERARQDSLTVVSHSLLSSTGAKGWGTSKSSRKVEKENFHGKPEAICE